MAVLSRRDGVTICSCRKTGERYAIVDVQVALGGQHIENSRHCVYVGVDAGNGVIPFTGCDYMPALHPGWLRGCGYGNEATRDIDRAKQSSSGKSFSLLDYINKGVIGRPVLAAAEAPEWLRV